jgi:hypothetical protein
VPGVGVVLILPLLFYDLSSLFLVFYDFGESLGR